MSSVDGENPSDGEDPRDLEHVRVFSFYLRELGSLALRLAEWLVVLGLFRYVSKTTNDLTLTIMANILYVALAVYLVGGGIHQLYLAEPKDEVEQGGLNIPQFLLVLIIALIGVGVVYFIITSANTIADQLVVLQSAS